VAKCYNKLYSIKFETKRKMSKHSFLQSTPQDLQRALGEVNRKMEEEETKAKAAALGLQYIDLKGFPVDLNVLGIFTKQEAENFGAVPFFKENEDLRIGMLDPYNTGLMEKIQVLSQKNKVSLYLISKTSFDLTVKFFSKVLRPEVRHEDSIKINSETDFSALLEEIKNPDTQKHKNASEFLDIIFGAAIFYGASDIHFEPEEDFVKLRFRVDGVLQDMLHIAKALQKSLVTRIKILSRLKLNVENVPQDGRITFFHNQNPIDVRVSILPSAYGEEIVMRLLGTGSVSLKLSALGFRPEVLALLNRQLEKPNGMIITTGPTGSGKTTTLYTFISELNKPGVKIITLEDPVEYKLEGVVQTPIDHGVDFSFAKGLRAILRQDPDIVMVGEIRDQETAETAMQAALTGHLVLSTLHTNDASGAIPRLINMGLKPFVVGPALSCVMAQRLVRKICQTCKTAYAISPTLMERIKIILHALPKELNIKLPENFQFYHSPGCQECKNLGYKGRVGIYEAIEVTEKIQDLIQKQSPMSEFKKAAIQQGMVTMAQDGILKALEGITDVEEVFRVAGE
jgi:type IV pilus assembly protein PilB